MSLVPILMHLARDLDAEHRRVDSLDRLLDDDFGFGINPVDIFRRPLWCGQQRSLYSPYMLSRRQHSDKNESSLIPTVGKDGFQVCMDVSQFKPSELTVKTVDNVVIVEGKHEEREDEHGMIQRHFIRKYTLPKDYDPNEVHSTISSDGVLTVKAAPPPSKSIQNERVVQIQQTGPAHLNVKPPEMTAQSLKQAQNGAHTDKTQQTTAK
ncbi:heat shock protein 27 [Stomoxys calcitrans]|uniref:SHSP domain-containing protein n=1 Tax=Stomoxys calcitrans TaxID=35570 RepID=A0A1I8P685_STOCA|nr:heat shock protein 27 [Stomoxys calcitrans]